MNKTKSSIGKGNSLFYTLIVTAFLTWNTISWSYTKEKGWSFSSKEVPLEVVTPCLVLMGVGLGVNLGGAFRMIADLASIVSRNSIAINTLANKSINQSPEEESKKDGEQL